MYLPWRGSHFAIMLAGSNALLVISATDSCSWYAFSAEMMGAYEDGACRLFVTSGLGHWMPFRLGCPPEVVVLELRRFSDQLHTVLLSTGQHREMLSQALAAFGLEADRDLGCGDEVCRI